MFTCKILTGKCEIKFECILINNLFYVNVFVKIKHDYQMYACKFSDCEKIMFRILWEQKV